MTKKDYERIAGALASIRPMSPAAFNGLSDFGKGAYRQWRKTVDALADALDRESRGRFKRDKFLKACGVEGGATCDAT